MKRYKLVAITLLLWYACVRWTLLAISNDASIEWLSDTFGNFIAVVSAIYLLIVIFNKNADKLRYFYDVTKALLAINAYFLSIMIAIFIHETNFVNGAYVLLDINILSFYYWMLNHGNK